MLRHSDSPAVRELAVACVAHASSSHPRGLGSGWRSVLEALAVAAGDEEATVVTQALDALQVGGIVGPFLAFSPSRWAWCLCCCGTSQLLPVVCASQHEPSATRIAACARLPRAACGGGAPTPRGPRRGAHLPA